MTPFDFHVPTRLVFGSGTLDRLGPLARELGFSRPLLVSDRGLEEAGHVDRALGLLRSAGLEVEVFDDFDVNPDAAMVERGVAFARARRPDSVIGLGGGSSLDCAKGINLLLTNGGAMADYRGYGHAHKPLLPMIAVPTTAGTGSEAQSYAVIADAETHMKMACGDPQLAFRVAVLDPDLTPVAADRRHRRGRFRCDRARGGDRGDEAPERGLDALLPRGVPSAERQTTSGCSTIPTTSRRAARCSSARSTQAWPSSNRCWGRLTRARTR